MNLLPISSGVASIVTWLTELGSKVSVFWNFFVLPSGSPWHVMTKVRYVLPPVFLMS